jgi:hypothetical protein
LMARNLHRAKGRRCAAAGKLSFRSMRDALKSAIKFKAMHSRAHKAYRCRACGLWHLATVK